MGAALYIVAERDIPDWLVHSLSLGIMYVAAVIQINAGTLTIRFYYSVIPRRRY